MDALTVLLPIDGSEGSQLAIDKAKALAEKYPIHFILLHSLDTRYKITGDDEYDTLLQKSAEGVGNKILSEAKAQFEGQDVRLELVAGRPGEQIVDFLENNPVDLVIMATQNISRVKRFLLGSVTNYVLNHSWVPVLAIPTKNHPSLL